MSSISEHTSASTVGEAIHVGRGSLLGQGDEDHVVHALVVAPEAIAGVHAQRTGVANHVTCRTWSTERDLLEERLLECHGERDSLLRVGGERHARLAELAEPLRPEPGERDEAAEREQRLVRRHVRRRLLAPDVLLARLQRQHETAIAVEVGRLAHDPAGHAADEVRARGEEAVVRAAVALRVAHRLPLADRQVAAVGAGRLEDAERGQVDVRDRERPGVASCSCEGRCVLEAAEEVRLREDDRRRALRCGCDARGIRDAVRVSDFDDLEPEPGRIGLDDLAHLGVQRLGEHDLRPTGRMLGDEAGVCGDGETVVPGRVRYVHACELTDRRLVLEDRLEHSLAHLGLIRRVRRQELAPLQDRVDDRRDVVVVDPCAEEGQLDACVDVLRRELLEGTHELGLAERRWDVKCALEPDGLGDLLEQIVDGRDADRDEHLVTILLREREIPGGHCSATTTR